VLPGPKKLKRPNLAISSFKKGLILKNEKRPNKIQMSLKKFVKITKLKLIISQKSLNLLRFVQNRPYNAPFLSTFKKRKKWPNGQNNLFLANSFKKGQLTSDNPDFRYSREYSNNLLFSVRFWLVYVILPPT